MAVPRLSLRGTGAGGDGAVVLPHPLDAGASARVRRIFALQRRGDIPAAIAETAQLTDDTLLGDLLADRYLGNTDTARPTELRLWLKRYADLPDAPAIYRLLASVSPHGSKAGPAPDAATLGTESPAAPLPEEEDPAKSAFTRNETLDHAVQDRLDNGPLGAGSALRLIAATHKIDPLYASQLRAEVALRLFTDGQDELALLTGQLAFAASDNRIGLAGYVAGLAAWRSGRLDVAESLFEAASHAPLTPASVRAGAAYWAARAHLRLGDPTAYLPWLQRAAAAPRTFYGMLARQRLGREGSGSDWMRHRSLRLVSLSGVAEPLQDAGSGRPSLSEIDVDAVAATPAGRRAFALLQVGEPARAEATLRRLWPSVQNDMALCRSIQLVSEAAGLTTLSAQLAGILQSRDGQPRDEARFPVPRLSPHHGFTVDPALVYALTRLESNFDAGAVSGAGAHGLMQIMPMTAGFVLGQPDRFSESAASLHDPALNLEIGQRYLAYLSKQGGVDGNLVRLLASYNAGPGAVGRWAAATADTADPLLFIESLPSDETRNYVRRAFTYLWVYADRLELPSPSLAALAKGSWPQYADEEALQPSRLH